MMKKSKTKQESIPARLSVDASKQPPRPETAICMQEALEQVSRADDGGATVAQSSSSPPTDAGPANLLDDMTDPAYLAAYKAIFGVDSIPIPDRTRTENEFLTFANKTRASDVIDREIRRLQQSNQIHEVYRVLKDKLEVLLEVRAEARAKINRLNHKRKQEFDQKATQSLPHLQIRENDLLGDQYVTIETLAELVKNRALKFTFWVLSFELPEIKRIGIDSEKLKRAIGRNMEKETKGRVEIKGAMNLLSVEIHNATQTTRIAKDSEIQAIYYHVAVNTAAGVLWGDSDHTQQVHIAKQPMELLLQYFDDRGIPKNPQPEDWEVLRNMNYREKNGNPITWRPEQNEKAKGIVNTIFGKLRKSVKQKFYEFNKYDGVLKALLDVGVAGHRGAKFRVIPFHLIRSDLPK